MTPTKREEIGVETATGTTAIQGFEQAVTDEEEGMACVALVRHSIFRTIQT
jgi:hypothetical protein